MIQSPEIQELLAECWASTAKFAKVMFPSQTSKPFSPSHLRMFERFDRPTRRSPVGPIKMATMAHREFGKTTLVDLVMPAKKILYNDVKFVVMISCSNTQAVMQTENLRNELQSNEMITKLFGNLTINQTRDPSSKDFWVTSNGVAILPRGAGQQIRGLLWRGRRPDLVIVDDVEDPEVVESEDGMKKLKKWFLADVDGVFDQSDTNTMLWVIGTMLHENSLMAMLADREKSPDWDFENYELCDDNFKSNWPAYLTDEQCKAKYEGFRKKGFSRVFFMEYRGILTEGEDSAFKQSQFKYYEEKDIAGNNNIQSVVLLDPAKTLGAESCDSAIVGVGYDCRTGTLYVRDILSKRFTPTEVVEEALNMCDRLDATTLGIEVTSLDNWITYPFRNAMLSRRRIYEILPLKPKGKKPERAKSLSPFYSMGRVYHNKTCCERLEIQLLAFPRCSSWDIIDAWAYIVPTLEQGGRFLVGRDEKEEEDSEKLEKEMMAADVPQKGEEEFIEGLQLV